MHMFRQLQHLDISNNPGVNGSLPSSWFALKRLQTLDVSGCSISGTLPALYMALQELKVFRAVSCLGISGRLPAEYGLLNLNTLQLTNTALTGTIPSEWANPAALRSLAASHMRALSGTSGFVNSTTHAAAAFGSVLVPSSSAPLRAASHSVAARLRAAQAGGALMGLQQLRVLDLSVASPGSGRLTGTLPCSFAAMKQLEVRLVAWCMLQLQQYMRSCLSVDDVYRKQETCLLYMRAASCCQLNCTHAFYMSLQAETTSDMALLNAETTLAACVCSKLNLEHAVTVSVHWLCYRHAG
jgi:hypothetical protein